MNNRKSTLNKLLKCLPIILLLMTATAAQEKWNLVRHSSPGDLVSVYFTDSSHGWVGGDDGYVAMTADGGQNWTRQNIGTKENINEIYFRNNENGYLLAGSRIYRTRDSGKSWRENIVINRDEFKGLSPEFLSVRFSSKKNGWIVGSLINKKEEVIDSLLLKTVDSGESWQRVMTPSKIELYSIDFVNDDNGWIVGDKGLILRTSTGGEQWIQQKSGVATSLYSVDFKDSETGLAVGGSGTILRTENAGESWQPLKTGFPKSLLRVLFATDKIVWAAGAGGVLLQSEDRGRNWARQTIPTGDSLFGLYADKKTGWAVGKKGLILKYAR